MTEQPRPLAEVIGSGLGWVQVLDLAQREVVRLLVLRSVLTADGVSWHTRDHIVHAPGFLTSFTLPDFGFAFVTKLAPFEDWRQLCEGDDRTVTADRFEAYTPTIALEVLDHEDHPDLGTWSAKTGEVVHAAGPLRGKAKRGVRLSRRNLWVLPSELAAPRAEPMSAPARSPAAPAWHEDAVSRAVKLWRADPAFTSEDGSPNLSKLAGDLESPTPSDGGAKIAQAFETVRKVLRRHRDRFTP